MRRHALPSLVLVLLLAAPAAAAGLLAPTDPGLPPLRVTDHLVDVDVRDGIAVTTVRQVFRNDTKRRLEATYVFPLPEEGDLTDFQMSFNGKMVKGKVLPAEEAARIYESIVRQAKDPGLIEFIGRRLLQMRVFPIEPESDTSIQISYQQICRAVSGMKAYHYPLRTRKTAGQAYGTVRFAVNLETATPLKSIWSPTHKVEIVRGADERSARIAYEANEGSLEDDFLLLYDTDSSDLGLSVVAYKPESARHGHFVLMLTPKQLWPDDEKPSQDVVFVLDTSGSMAGDKIEQARRALGYCIESLGERDRFSVVRFSTGFDVLFEEVRAATKEARAEARTWVEGFSAAGGTNIADTLVHVAQMERDRAQRAERPFVVVFLTDGRGNRQPAEIMNLLADAGPEAPAMRVFPFGVGHDVNTKLLDRLSDVYTGRTTYVQPGENLELVLGDFFSVISRPVLSSLRVALPEIGATERFPATLGDLYHGQQIIVAGRFAEEGTGSVSLSAMRSGERVDYKWSGVAFRHTEGADYVPTVWAGRKIAYLIDQIRVNGESTEMVEEILALSQEYGIQTPYTSWLVNPERAVTRLGRRGAPGSGGGGAMDFPWQRGATVSRDGVRAKLRGAAGRPPAGLSGSGGSLFGDPGDDEPAYRYGDEFDEIDLMVAGESVNEASGRVANLIARRNVELKSLRSKDEGRLDPRMLAYVRIDGRWYHRMGRYLVDERVGEKTEIVAVRFASDAYFEIVRGRADLRKALAASPTVVVMTGDGVAVLVSERTGLESLTDEQRERFGV